MSVKLYTIKKKKCKSILTEKEREKSVNVRNKYPNPNLPKVDKFLQNEKASHACVFFSFLKILVHIKDGIVSLFFI